MSDAELNVLMVTPFSPLQPGGVQRYVFEVATRMLRRGVNVEVLCSDPTRGGVERQERDGLWINTVGAYPRGRDWCFAPGMWRGMSARPWDVIHVQSYHTLVAPLAMTRALTLGIPYCLTFHGGGHTSDLRNRARPLQRHLLAPLLVRAAALVAVAKFEVEAYGGALGIPPERFRVIPVGTDLVLPDAGNAGQANPEPAEGPVLATIGRLERYKGHQRVIEALAALRARHEHARLLIVGKGPYGPLLERRAEELGVGDQVQITSIPPGDTTGMARLLSTVSIVVLMSDFETHPQVALEAAAANRRLLVADDGAGLRELARDGLARAIPLDSTAEQVAAAIEEELHKPPPSTRPALSSWDECVERQLALYREIRR